MTTSAALEVWVDEEYEKLLDWADPAAAPPFDPSSTPAGLVSFKKKRQAETKFRRWVLFTLPKENLDVDEWDEQASEYSEYSNEADQWTAAEGRQWAALEADEAAREAEEDATKRSRPWPAISQIA